MTDLAKQSADQLLMSRVHKYRIVDVVTDDRKTVSANSDFNGLDFVTVSLQRVDSEDTFMDSTRIPSVTIVGSTEGLKAKVKAITSCKDPDTGKYDKQKLWDLGNLEGVYGNWGEEWGVYPFWQENKDQSGKVTPRVYQTGADKGKPMPGRSITMFVWKQTIEDGAEAVKRAVQAAMSNRKPIVWSDTEQYSYQRPTAQQIMEQIKGSASEAQKAADIEGAADNTVGP